MDRNQRARDQEAQRIEIAKMRREFAAAVAAGNVHVLDRFAVPVEEGSLVVWKPPYDLVWLVKSVTPVMDPRQGSGLLQVTLTADVPNIQIAGNVPQINLIVCGKQGKAPQESKLVDVGETPDEPHTETLGDA